MYVCMYVCVWSAYRVYSTLYTGIAIRPVNWLSVSTSAVKGR